MALTEVKFTALQIFQATIERDLKELSTIHDMETDISRKREYAKEILKLTIKLKNF